MGQRNHLAQQSCSGDSTRAWLLASCCAIPVLGVFLLAGLGLLGSWGGLATLSA